MIYLTLHTILFISCMYVCAACICETSLFMFAGNVIVQKNL